MTYLPPEFAAFASLLDAHLYPPARTEPGRAAPPWPDCQPALARASLSWPTGRGGPGDRLR